MAAGRGETGKEKLTKSREVRGRRKRETSRTQGKVRKEERWRAPELDVVQRKAGGEIQLQPEGGAAISYGKGMEEDAVLLSFKETPRGGEGSV